MGGHGRAGGKRNQAVGGGGAESKRDHMPLQQKKKQLGLPELGTYSKRMDRVINKQRKAQNHAMKRVEEEESRKRRRLDEIKDILNTNQEGDEAMEGGAAPEGVNIKRGQFAALMLKANSSETQFKAKQDFLEETRKKDADISLNRSRENSKRRFWTEFQKVVKVSDVLLEVLDARDPLGCRLGEIERTIDSQFAGKKKFVLILNKVDLAPKENVLRWLEYFRVEGIPVVAFSAAGGGKAAAQETSTTKTYEDPTHRCVHHLLETLRKFQKTEAGGRRRITVGIVGFPNVGKSSVINALKRERVVGTGNTPGVTTTAQEISLQGHIKIVDCPGVVISDGTTAETALRNAAKIEHLQDVVGPCELIFQRCGADRIRTLYRLPPALDSFDAIIAAVAEKKGKLLRGGKPNIEDACRILLKDWNDGRIPYYTVPPNDRDFIQSPTQAGGALSAEEAKEETTILDRLTARDTDFVQLGSSEKTKVETTYMVDNQALFSRKRKTTHVEDSSESEDDDDDAEPTAATYNPFKVQKEKPGGQDLQGGFLGEDAEDVARDNAALQSGLGDEDFEEEEDESRARGARPVKNKKKFMKKLASENRRMLRVKRPAA